MLHTPLPDAFSPTVKDRFIESVEKNGPIPAHQPHLGQCWEWTKTLAGGGYGTLMTERHGVGKYKSWPAHRLSWLFHFGEIPPGICVLHKCDNRKCVNPDHLFLGTKLDNVRDMLAKVRGTQGEKSYWAKLTEDDVRAIRKAYSEGVRQVDLRRIYKVCEAQMFRIVNRLQWRHIK